MIRGKNITFIYKNGAKGSVFQPTLSNVSFTIPLGRITAFIGKSGSGKTSLFKCITHLNTPYTGTISYKNSDLAQQLPKQRASMVGFVSQQFDLFPHLSVSQNCIQPLQVVRGITKKEATNIALKVLSQLEMDALKDVYPAQLSGGQQQRVAIARVLCFDPDVLLFDEPTSALDPQNTNTIARIMKDLALQGKAIGITSHDVSFVKEMLDRIYLMQDGTIVDCFDNKIDSSLENNCAINAFIRGD